MSDVEQILAECRQKSKHTMVASAFKSNDIRGIVGEELLPPDAYFIGRSFGSWLNRAGLKTCLLAYDGRFDSKDFSILASNGMADSGIEVTVIGLVSTPTAYFALKKYNFDAGMIITASHNPKQYNGFKMLTQSGPFFDENIQLLSKMMTEGDLVAKVDPAPAIKHQDVKQDYLNFLLSVLRPATVKPYNVVFDTGNGAVSYIIKDLVAKLPGNHKIICGEIDPNFPNHDANPCIEKNMAMLKEAVKEGNFDLGIAFDGDGDRLGLIDRNGYFYYGDETLLYYARDFLEDNPGETVMVEVKASLIFGEEIKKYGGKPLLCHAGHSPIKEKMQREGIKLAGETSGHIYWGENYNFDDGAYSAIKLLNILNSGGQDLADFHRALPVTYSTKEERFTVEESRKFAIVDEVAKRLTKENDPRIVDIITIDGLRVEYPQGWVLIRASNTQADISTRAEGKTPEDLAQMESIIREQLSLSGVKI